MSVAELVLNVAYVCLLGSTLTRTLTWLRCMLILGALAFITFGTLENIPEMVAWNCVICAMHSVGVVRDQMRRRSVNLSREEIALRNEFFPGLSDFDFHMLWCMGRSVMYDNDIIIEEGSLPTATSIVLRGAAAIEQCGQVARGVGRGGLIGEMSLVSGQPATVNVLARGQVEVRQWDHRELTSLDQVHPASARAFHDLVTRGLVAKARV